MEQDELAKAYAIKKGYNLVRYCGTVGGQRIYNYTRTSMVGKKTGVPHFLKVDESKNVTNVEDYYERINYAPLPILDTWKLHQ